MFVLIAAHDCYPDPGSGGTGRYVYETARRLVDRGHRVEVVTRRRGRRRGAESVEGVTVRRYDLAVAERPATAVLPGLAHAARTVRRHVADACYRGPPDVVSLQGPTTAALVDRAVPDDVPRVATFHSPWPTEYRIRTRGADGADGPRRRLNAALRRRVERRLLACADAVVTLSEYMREQCREVYGDGVADGARVIPRGVDTALFAPDGPTDGRIRGDPAVLTVRRLSERMGHANLLRAFSRVRESHPDARLYVAGDGPVRGRLEALAAELGVADATTFLGYVPDAELPAVYRSADLFALPAEEPEGFGLATLEALASGLPVVATPVGGTVELLSDLESAEGIHEPLLTRSAEPAALADGLDAWAGLDADRRERAGRACRAYAERRYTWDRTVDGIERLYRGLVPGGGDVGRDCHDGRDRPNDGDRPDDSAGRDDVRTAGAAESGG